MSLELWLKSGRYLPKFMRDFHDQKELFKAMHHVYEGSDSLKPAWIDGHCYVIDCFLWYMASRGYTLQKTRANVEFKEFAKVPSSDLGRLVGSADHE